MHAFEIYELNNVFNSKGFQGFILRTFRCNYGKLRENDRTDSPIRAITHSQNDFLFVRDLFIVIL